MFDSRGRSGSSASGPTDKTTLLPHSRDFPLKSAIRYDYGSTSRSAPAAGVLTISPRLSLKNLFLSPAATHTSRPMLAEEPRTTLGPHFYDALQNAFIQWATTPANEFKTFLTLAANQREGIEPPRFIDNPRTLAMLQHISIPNAALMLNQAKSGMGKIAAAEILAAWPTDEEIHTRLAAVNFYSEAQFLNYIAEEQLKAALSEIEHSAQHDLELSRIAYKDFYKFIKTTAEASIPQSFLLDPETFADNAKGITLLQETIKLLNIRPDIKTLIESSFLTSEFSPEQARTILSALPNAAEQERMRDYYINFFDHIDDIANSDIRSRKNLGPALKKALELLKAPKAAHKAITSENITLSAQEAKALRGGLPVLERAKTILASARDTTFSSAQLQEAFSIFYSFLVETDSLINKHTTCLLPKDEKDDVIKALRQFAMSEPDINALLSKIERPGLTAAEARAYRRLLPDVAHEEKMRDAYKAFYDFIFADKTETTAFKPDLRKLDYRDLNALRTDLKTVLKLLDLDEAILEEAIVGISPERAMAIKATLPDLDRAPSQLHLLSPFAVVQKHFTTQQSVQCEEQLQAWSDFLRKAFHAYSITATARIDAPLLAYMSSLYWGIRRQLDDMSKETDLGITKFKSNTTTESPSPNADIFGYQLQKYLARAISAAGLYHRTGLAPEKCGDQWPFQALIQAHFLKLHATITDENQARTAATWAALADLCMALRPFADTSLQFKDIIEKVFLPRSTELSEDERQRLAVKLIGSNFLPIIKNILEKLGVDSASITTLIEEGTLKLNALEPDASKRTALAKFHDHLMILDHDRGDPHKIFVDVFRLKLTPEGSFINDLLTAAPFIADELMQFVAKQLLSIPPGTTLVDFVTSNPEQIFVPLRLILPAGVIPKSLYIDLMPTQERLEYQRLAIAISVQTIRAVEKRLTPDNFDDFKEMFNSQRKRPANLSTAKATLTVEADELAKEFSRKQSSACCSLASIQRVWSYVYPPSVLNVSRAVASGLVAGDVAYGFLSSQSETNETEVDFSILGIFSAVLLAGHIWDYRSQAMRNFVSDLGNAPSWSAFRNPAIKLLITTAIMAIGWALLPWSIAGEKEYYTADDDDAEINEKYNQFALLTYFFVYFPSAITADWLFQGAALLTSAATRYWNAHHPERGWTHYQLPENAFEGHPIFDNRDSKKRSQVSTPIDHLPLLTDVEETAATAGAPRPVRKVAFKDTEESPDAVSNTSGLLTASPGGTGLVFSTAARAPISGRPPKIPARHHGPFSLAHTDVGAGALPRKAGEGSDSDSDADVEKGSHRRDSLVLATARGVDWAPSPAGAASKPSSSQTDLRYGRSS